MGFYGNITNTSKTTFQFDRIYPNRLAMDAGVNDDGIFIGRYVLVEYQNDATYFIVYKKGSNFYSSPNCENLTRIKFLSGTRADNTDADNNGYFDGIYENEIVQNYVGLKYEGNNIKFDRIDYYKCTGGNSSGYAIFDKIVLEKEKSDYITNFEIDEKHYSNEKGFKGYDSTVWTKVSVESEGKLITKYVHIADLNSVVPTFDIAADAPTMTPITPHFDADSTNVYYKLHMQSPYGFRVKEGVQGKSDESTTWYKTSYDKENDETTTTSISKPYADIYYNKAGFDPKKVSKVKDTNYIKLEPTGRSDAQYSHGNDTKDIQEFSLHLPAIGNMMSDAWDIIHGPNRDDAQTDENGSLQGRLDSFKAMEENAIPMKRNTDGTFVGSRINGNSNKTVGTNKILEEELSTSFDQDDAWICTKINTTGLDNKTKLSGISIHHTWHKQADTTSTSNKNTDEVSSSKASDKLSLYTPIVDAAGHIVGKNTETVTLPYGFKTIATNGRSTSTTENATGTPSTSNIVAENTQDVLNIDSGNKWIRIDTTPSSDTLTIKHDVHNFETNSNGHTNLNTEDGAKQEDNLVIYDWDYDKAGHITEKHKHTYTLPYSYKTIQIENSNGTGNANAGLELQTIQANKTQAKIKYEAANKWINMESVESSSGTDTIYFGHITNGNGFGKTYYAKNSDLKENNTYKQEPKFGETANILNVTVDNAGHITAFNSNTIKIPQGSYTPANSATTHTDIITSIGFTPSSGAITSTRANTNTLTLYNYSANSGNLDIKSTDTINDGLKKIQNHINGLDMSSTSTTEFITEITQIDGQVAVKRAKAGTLELGTDSTEKTVLGTDSLNQAINKIEARIKAEEEARKAAINTLYGTENGIDIAKTFDTIKEIADFLEQDENETQSGIEKILYDIQFNAMNIATESYSRIRLESELKELIGESPVSQQIDEKINTFNSTLGNAAYTDSSAYATAAQGTTADNTANIIASYGDIVTYKADDFVSKEEYNALLEDYNELKNLVDKLNKQLNPEPETPVEGE